MPAEEETPEKPKRKKDIQEKPINEFFEENGFETRSLIKNLGSTFLYLVLLVFILITIPLWKLMESSENDENPSRLTRFSRWLRKHMLWGFTLRFVLQ